jgi:ferric-dicitrate binding protein FerR (iron transport regulator)
MKSLSNRDLRRYLRQADPPPAMMPREEFWQEFHARLAASAPAEHATAATPAFRFWWRYAGAGLAAAAALLMVLLALQQPPSPRPESGSALSKVQEVNVYADYDTMLIVEDEKNGSTMIWVAGLPAETDRQRMMR